jgi:multidrug efflux pump subunit AcrB
LAPIKKNQTKESPIYAILEMRKKIEALSLPEGYRIQQNTARIPESDRRYAMKWDGEWHITYEVFRDLGIAFGVVLVLIFVLVVGWPPFFFSRMTVPILYFLDKRWESTHVHPASDSVIVGKEKTRVTRSNR